MDYKGTVSKAGQSLTKKKQKKKFKWGIKNADIFLHDDKKNKSQNPILHHASSTLHYDSPSQSVQ